MRERPTLEEQVVQALTNLHVKRNALIFEINNNKNTGAKIKKSAKKIDELDKQILILRPLYYFDSKEITTAQEAVDFQNDQ